MTTNWTGKANVPVRRKQTAVKYHPSTSRANYSSPNSSEETEANDGSPEIGHSHGSSSKKRAKSDPVVPKVCFLCEKQNVIHGERIYESGWITCSWKKDTDKACLASAHTDCVGFPGLIDETEIEHLPDFYCSTHKQCGRAQQNVSSSYLEVDDSSNSNSS